jgi:hypothetical protein
MRTNALAMNLVPGTARAATISSAKSQDVESSIVACYCVRQMDRMSFDTRMSGGRDASTRFGEA